MSAPLRILIVEDNPADVDLVREALSGAGSAGFRVESAPRLSAALARLEAEGIDLVLLDLGLPDSQGLDTFRRLRDAAPDVPAIVLTGNVDQAVGLAAVSEGAQDYLVKGEVTNESVARSIRHAIERRRAEERLRESEGRFRSYVENANDIVYTLSPSGILTYVSQNWEVTLGHDVRDVIGQSFTRFVHPDDVPACRRFLEQALATGGRAGRIEYRVQHKDGSWRWHSSSGSALVDGTSTLTSYIGIARDITARKQAEQALSMSEERFRRVSLLASDVVYSYIAKEDGRFALDWMTGAAEHVTGYSLEEIMAQGCWSYLVVKDDLGLFEENVVGLPHGLKASCELRLRHKNGGIVWLSSYAESDSETQTPGRRFLLGSLTDITKRKQAEERIRASEAHLEEVQRMAHLGSWEMDLITGQTTWSDELCRLFEIPPETIRAGRSQLRAAIDERIHPDDRARYTQAVARTVDQKMPYDIDYRIQLPDGSQRHIHAEGAPSSDPAGNLVRLAGTAMDITERKQAELERERLLRREIALNHITLALGQLTALPAILRALHDEVRTLLDADGLFVSRYHKDAGLITALFAIDAGTERDVSTFPPIPLAPEGKGMQSHVLRTLKPLNVPDWLEWERRMQTVHHIAADGTFTPPPPETERENRTKSSLLVPMMFQGEPIGVLQVQSNRLHAYSDEDMDLLAGLANVAAISIQNALLVAEAEQAAERLRLSLEGALHAVSHALETRDPYTAGHQRRATHLAVAIARELGCSDEDCNALRIAGTVHDIGKIGIPAEILSKPALLSPVELELIRTHPEAGYGILADIPFPGPVADIVLQHHERLDGSGYPRGLKGDQMLREARILAVADVVEAMASHRPYRPARGIDDALGEIEQNAGRLYDSEAACACARLFRDKGYALPA